MQTSNSGYLQPSPAFSSQPFLTPESAVSLSLSNFETADGDESAYYTLNNSDYSTTLDDILSEDGEADERNTTHEFIDDGDEGFLYTGVDAPEPGDYTTQLNNVLEEDTVSDSEAEVERSLPLTEEPQQEEEEEEFSYEDQSKEFYDTSPPPEENNNHAVAPTITLSLSPVKPVKRSFLHPSVSRLRSLNPQWTMSDSPDTSGMSPVASNVSSLSRRSSILSEFAHMNGEKALPREAFRWSPLKVINSQVFSSNRANSDAADEHGEPTVIVTNGLICVGTRKGRVLVFDFKQKLNCVCGASAAAEAQGAVTAVALSQDHTFVAAGHNSGHIFLYNLEKPNVPARSVPTTTVAAVASGRKEGHLANARISRIGFVGKRHTGIISSDENGLAFYHSLGKVLFIEATDVLRVLGKYPGKDSETDLRNGELPLPRKHSTILVMAPLPLGGIPDSVDEYNLTALITPVKLVIVGLKPSPRTWFRQHRGDISPGFESRWRGCLTWQPLIKTSDSLEEEKPKRKKGVQQKTNARPMLMYSWGRECRVLSVREEITTIMVTNPKTGKTSPVANGKVLFDERVRWSASHDIVALQWLNSDFAVGIMVSHTIQVWEIQSGSLVESSMMGNSVMSWSPSIEGSLKHPSLGNDFGQSLRTYKDKVFLLHQNRLVVGSLLHWTDRILAYVQNGDFLSAIDLTRSYFVGEAPGNQIGLPEDATARRQVLSTKLKELMTASIAYSFSEDRLTDQTHVTPDGRGVDRTSLFENLATSCAKSCIELNDLDFFYEELFERYSDWGINTIFLVQLEPFVLDNLITYVPPRITQQLIARHVEKGDLSAAERLIWHLDPQCLDIDQAINLCKQNGLWDAMIYVYCAALRDFVSPIVELLALIRWMLRVTSKVQSGAPLDTDEETRMETLTPVSYKLFPYLSTILCGLTYPSRLPMDDMDAFNAKQDIYSFLFSGRSAVWPKGEVGKLIATAEEEGGAEPTYPYLRLMLRFDAESFLNALDIAFEDSFLNESSSHVNRLLIVKILLDIQDSLEFISDDITLMNIFIARNIPKYPQYLGLLPSSTLEKVLFSLMKDINPDTVEDRQLAAEFLLSAFKPHRSHELESKMREAQFYRILRNWYQQDRSWPDLLAAYVDDPTITPSELIEDIASVFQSTGPNDKMKAIFLGALPRLTESCLTETASLVDRHAPELHTQVLTSIGDDCPFQQLLYLEFLVETESGSDPSAQRRTSSHLKMEHREKYLSLLCSLRPDRVIHILKSSFPSDSHWTSLEEICLTAKNYSAAVWCAYSQQNLKATFTKWQSYNEKLTENFVQELAASEDLVTDLLNSFKSLHAVALEICENESRSGSSADDFLTEDMWFSTLAVQINIVQSVSSQKLIRSRSFQERALQSLRSFVEETLTARMRVGSSDPAEFPDLFKRLVDATASTRSNSESSYSEFRLILGEMLTSYRTEEDLLDSVSVLLGKDLLGTIKQVAKARNKGWRPSHTLCQTCSNPISDAPKIRFSESDETSGKRIVISRTGAVYHEGCFTLS